MAVNMLQKSVLVVVTVSGFFRGHCDGGKSRREALDISVPYHTLLIDFALSLTTKLKFLVVHVFGFSRGHCDGVE